MSNTNGSKEILNNQPEQFSGFRRKTILTWMAGILGAFFLVVVFLVTISIGVFRYFINKAPDPLVSYRVNRQVEAGISSWVPAEVAGGQTIPVRLTKVLEANIPFKQDVDVWIDKDFTIPVDVQVDLEIPKGIIPGTD